MQRLRWWHLFSWSSKPINLFIVSTLSQQGGPWLLIIATLPLNTWKEIWKGAVMVFRDKHWRLPKLLRGSLIQQHRSLLLQNWYWLVFEIWNACQNFSILIHLALFRATNITSATMRTCQQRIVARSADHCRPETGEGLLLRWNEFSCGESELGKLFGKLLLLWQF